MIANDEINNSFSEQCSIELEQQQPFLFVNKTYDYTIYLKQNNQTVYIPCDITIKPYMTDYEDADPYIKFLTPSTGRLNEKGEFPFQFKLTHLTKLTAEDVHHNSLKKMYFNITASQNDEMLLQYDSIPFVCVKYQLIVKCLQTTEPYLLFYKDRGGKESGIELSITLENEQGNMVLNKTVDLQASLLYENGLQVLDQRLLVATTSQNNPITREDFQLKNGYKQLKFRINQVSSKHCNQKFLIHVAAPLRTEEGGLIKEYYEIAPADSIPIEVRSKKNKRPLKLEQGNQYASENPDENYGEEGGEWPSVSALTPIQSVLQPIPIIPSIPSAYLSSSMVASSTTLPFSPNVDYLQPPEKKMKLNEQKEGAFTLLTAAAAAANNRDQISTIVDELKSISEELHVTLQKSKSFQDDIYKTMQEKFRWKLLVINDQQTPVFDAKNPNETIDEYLRSRNVMEENYRKMEIVYRKLQSLFVRSMQHLFHHVSKGASISSNNDVPSNSTIQSSEGTVDLYSLNSKYDSLTSDATNISSMVTTELPTTNGHETFEVVANEVGKAHPNPPMGSLDPYSYRAFLASASDSGAHLSPKGAVDVAPIAKNSLSLAILSHAAARQTTEDGVQYVFTEFATVDGNLLGFPAFQYHNKRGLKLLGFYNVLPGDSNEKLLIDEELKAKVGRIWNSHSCKISRETFLTGDDKNMWAVVDSDQSPRRLFAWKVRMCQNPDNPFVNDIHIFPKKYYLHFNTERCEDLKVQAHFQDRLPDDFDKHPRCFKKSTDSAITEEEHLWKLKECVLKQLHHSDSAPFTGSIYPKKA